jgi:hypothetical protein
MNFKDEDVLPADDVSAPGTDQSDEDIWNELAAEGAGQNPDGDDDAALKGIGDDPEEDDAPGEDVSAAAEELDEDDLDEDGDTELDLDDDDDQQDELTRLKEQNQQLEEENRRMKGRQPALDRKISTLQKELDSYKNAPPGESEEQRASRQETLNSLSNEYGDITGPLVDHIKDLEGRLDRLNESDTASRERIESELQSIEAEQQAIFDSYHEDGLSVVAENKDVFLGWIQDQPKKYRDIFEKNNGRLVDGAGAALLVTRFKLELMKADGGSDTQTETSLLNKRARQLDGARTTRSASRKTITEDPGRDSTDDQALWDYWDRQDKKKGR